MSTQKWTADPFAEQQMRKLGVEWRVEEIDLSDIDWERSAANVARIGTAIDHGFVDELTIVLQNGDHLPMPVLRLVGKKYVIFSGHHRLPAAKRANVHSVSAYIFSSEDDAVLHNLHKILNPPVRAVPRLDRLIFARNAVLKDGFNNPQAAKLYCLNEKSLRDFIAAENTREKLVSLHVDGAMKFPSTLLESLARVKNINVLRAAGRIAHAGKLSVDEVKGLVKDILHEETEAAQMGVVGEMEKSCNLNGAPINTSPVCRKGHAGPVVLILRSLSMLEKYSHVRVVSQWGITDKNQKMQLIERIKKITGKLQAICKRSTDVR